MSGNEAEQTRTVVRTNALETFEYDGNGNLTHWVSGAHNWSYEWGWADRLPQVASNGVVVLQNWYDASGRRIAKAEVVNGQIVKTPTLYDGWDIVGVMNEAGQLRETFTWGVGLAGDIGTLVTVTHQAGSSTSGTLYAHPNHRGDVILTRSGGTTVGRYDYAAFGTLQSQTGPDVCRLKFSTKERVTSSGFRYYGSRFYAPSWQRWVNRDPLRESAGLNLYRFWWNNPGSFYDPDGRWVIPVVVGIVALWEYFCVNYAVDKGVEAYPTNDKAQHCMISCLHNRCMGLGAPSATLLAGLLWELRPGGVFDWGDVVADVYGVVASYNLFQSCKDSCKCSEK